MENKAARGKWVSYLGLFCLSLSSSIASEVRDNYLSKGLYPSPLIEKNVFDSTKKAKVVFNLPPYLNPGGVGIVSEMIKTIDAAESSIRMSMFQMNHAAVFEALKRAVSRNVRVFITTDLCYSGKSGYKEYFEDLKAFLSKHGQSAGTQIVDDATASCETMFNHNKYMIVDIENAKKVNVWIGSFNPTNHGATENVELAVIVNDKAPAEILKLDFEQQLSGKFKVYKKGVYSVIHNNQESIQSLDDIEIAALKKKGAIITYPRFKAGDAEFEFILSPKVKSLTRIIEEVYKAKSEILFSSFAIADQMLISSLINKTNTTGIQYNNFSILTLPHPYDSEGYSLIKNGDIYNQTEIFKKSEKIKKPSVETLNILKPIVDEILVSLATPANYLTPKNELKSTIHYIYPRGEAGGIVPKVKVEGIFNSKVIDEKNTLQRLNSYGVPVYKSTLNGELHNKLFLIDETVTIFGSHNFSQSAENSNDELTILIHSPRLAKFLKEELYEKTKLFSLKYISPKPSFTQEAGIAITEIMTNSRHKMSWNKKIADIGSFIEIHNYGDRAVNMLGFRYDDNFFPDYNNEQLNGSTLTGFQGTLVRFIPNATEGQLGQLDFEPAHNELLPGETALIVGKYFNENFYKEQFKKNFKAKHGHEPLAADFPKLFSSGEYFSAILGDSTFGLSSKDKITIYGIDGTTVIDQFSTPYAAGFQGISLERSVDRERLKSELKAKSYSYETRNFSLKNGKTLSVSAFLPNTGFSHASDWSESKMEGGTPGLLDVSNRMPASSDRMYTIEAEYADVESNNFKKALIVIKNDKFFDITSDKNHNYPAPIIKDVLIFPGLIDAHNHIKYNTMPVWKSSRYFDNRNLWPEETVYKKGIKEIYKNVYGEWSDCTQADELDRSRCLANNRCKIMKYAELKALIGGTTSIQGSSSFDETTSDITFKGLTGYTIGAGNKMSLSKARTLENMLDACSSDLARNIERELWRGRDEIRTTAQSIFSDAFAKNSINDATRFPQTPSGKLNDEFDNGITNTFFIHLGEGRDQISRSEWSELSYLKLARPQTTVIHGTAFELEEFKQMGASGLSLAWSPTSNLLLYKKTTNVPEALKNKVNVALGSDWSLSGTKSMLYELKVAAMANKKYFDGAITNGDLLKMATINGAKASHLENMLGSIDKFKLADFFLVSNKHREKTPLETLLKINESNIEAVFVGGIPQVGKNESLTAFNHALGLNSDVTVIKDASCYANLAVLMPAQALDGVVNILAHKTAAAFSKLDIKNQNGLGSEFSRLDPLCTDNDQRALSILQSL